MISAENLARNAQVLRETASKGYELTNLIFTKVAQEYDGDILKNRLEFNMQFTKDGRKYGLHVGVNNDNSNPFVMSRRMARQIWIDIQIGRAKPGLLPS